MLNESWTMHYYKRQMMGKRVQLKEKTPINFRNRCQTPRQSWWALKQERRVGTLANQIQPTLMITTDNFMTSSDIRVSCLCLYRVARKKKRRYNKQWTLNTQQRVNEGIKALHTKGHELNCR